MYKVRLRRVSRPLLSGETIFITYSLCVLVALGVEHATRVSHILS